MGDFYLTLPSNSSMDVYPHNTMANFKTNLPNRIELEGRWEVGMVEMQYPHSWYNLREEDGQLTVLSAAAGAAIATPLNITPGYYDTIEDLLRRIENVIANCTNLVTGGPLSLQYDKIIKFIATPHEFVYGVIVIVHVVGEIHNDGRHGETPSSMQ